MNILKYSQKLFRGFSDSDCHDLDYTLTKFILPRLKRFKELVNGNFYPSSLMSEIYKKYGYSLSDKIPSKLHKKLCKEISESWNAILDTMIQAFQDIIDEEDNYDKWIEDNMVAANIINNKIKKLKTDEEKWELVCKFRNPEFNKKRELFVSDIDISRIRRVTGLTVFAKYFESLWY